MYAEPEVQNKTYIDPVINLSHEENAIAQLDELERLYFETGLSDVPELQLAYWQHEPVRGWRTAQSAITRAATAQCHKDVVDGQPLTYWESGQNGATTILLLHGFGSCKENWAFVNRLLSNEYHVLVPDLFGFGDSHFRYGKDYSIAAQARRLHDWLVKRGHQQVVVVGNSMGGAIAAQMAAMDTKLIKGICLMNSAGAPGNRLSQLELSISRGENLLIPKDFSETRRLFETAMHGNKQLMGNALAMLMTTNITARAAVNHYLFGELVRSLRQTWHSLSSIKIPTLILWGDNDKILDPSCIDAFNRKLPHAKTLILPNVGHLPMLESPRKTTNMIKWLAASL